MPIFAELKRRNVFKVAAAYLALGWIVTEVTSTISPVLHLPEWLPAVVVWLGIIGFPFVVIFSWTYELTPDGIKLEKDVDRSHSVAGRTGNRLSRLVVVLLLVGISLLVSERYWRTEPTMNEQDSPIEAQFSLSSQSTSAFANSIAVLPFINMSGDPAQEYFSDGISEELLNVLVSIDGLRVASRTSSFAYKERVQSIPNIASELNVGLVLEGSVRRSGDQLRITAQLIDATDDRHLWSDSYDRTLKDIFAIQSEIANAIAIELQGRLGLNATPVKVPVVTQDLDAYELYLEGRTRFMQRGSSDDVSSAIGLLKQAVSLDPQFVGAWQYLAAAYAAAPYWGIFDRSLDEYTRLGADAIGTALGLDPDNAFSFAIRGFIGSEADSNNYAVDAISDMNHALELNPGLVDALNWRGANFIELGLFDLGMQDQQRCLALDSGYRNCRMYKWAVLLYEGRMEEANTELLGLLQTGSWYVSAEYVPFALVSGGPVLAMVMGKGIADWDNAPIMEWIDAMQGATQEKQTGWLKWQAWAKRSDQSIPQVVMASYEKWGEINLLGGDNFWVWLPMFHELRQSEPFRIMAATYGFPKLWKEYGYPTLCRPLGQEDFECD